jgi:Family of unknown function (DUF6114)
VTTADPVTPTGGTRRARTAWRNWRRSRPFWGGLLIVLGGGEILSTSVVSLGPTFRVGLGGVDGFLGTVIAFVLALCGLLLWFSPAQRVFYSIVAVVLALATFNTINYGGFFIGMLLGIIGGGLAFAWSAGTGKPAAHDPGPDGGKDRILSLAALPLSLPLLLGAGWQVQAANVPQGGHGCILFLLCPPASPSPGPAGTSSPGPAGSSSPAPGLGPPGPAPSPGGRARKPPAAKIKRTRSGGGLVAATVPSVLTAGSARLVGLAYDGVAEVPQSSGHRVPMMKFTLQSVTLTGRPTLTIHQNSSVAVTSTSLLSFSGHVVLYATKLSGDLLGVPVTLTASSPLSLVLRLLKPLTQGLTVTMTNVVTDQPVTTSDASQWAGFLISVRPLSPVHPASGPSGGLAPHRPDAQRTAAPRAWRQSWPRWPLPAMSASARTVSPSAVTSRPGVS